jgi:hypothetical protein
MEWKTFGATQKLNYIKALKIIGNKCAGAGVNVETI